MILVLTECKHSYKMLSRPLPHATYTCEICGKPTGLQPAPLKSDTVQQIFRRRTHRD